MSGIEDLRARGMFMRGGSSQYVAYVYPSRDAGPRAPGARPVLVYHR